MTLRIGWYVHHHGAGHRVRAETVAAVLAGRGHEVTLLGSGLRAGSPFATVDLVRDDEGGAPRDPSAGGRLHWAPLRDRGIRDRGAAIADWVARTDPDVLVVDVSVEVGLLARLLGVPVVVVAQPGVRTDEPHRLGYATAAAVLAPWPGGWAEQLAPHLGEVVAPVVEVGGITRLGGRGVAGPGREGRPAVGSRTGVVLAGGEGFDDPGLVDRLVAASPELRWQVLDGRVWVEDVGGALAGAEVVVAHAGQNAVADVAASGRPVLLLPQERPYREQERMAEALAARGLARVVGRARQVDPATDWAGEVSAARQGAGPGDAWETAGAARRAADVVEAAARG